ncbi:MAG: IclR family transcriptional regulator [Stackebrandtia sp.]
MTEPRSSDSAIGPKPESAAKAEPSDLIRSVQRALRVMEIVGDYPNGLSAKQIARRCGLNLPTTYHLVRTLAYEGYLIRGRNGIFQVGLALSDRYADLAKAMAGPATVGEVLRRTVGDTGYSHYLGRIVDGRAAVTAVNEGARSPHIEDLIVGFDDGAHAHALGKALLSTMSATDRRGYLNSAGMRRYTDNTMTEPGDLEYDLAQRAASGVYTEIGQFHPGVGCAATVVRDDPDPRHRTVIACTMPLFDLRQNGSMVKSRLRRAAVELETLL